MKGMLTTCLLALGIVVSLPAQSGKPASPDAKEILGRWIGSVTADVGEMSLGLELKEKDGKIAGTLETMHGNWSVDSATMKDGKWTLTARAEDGTEGHLIGQVKAGTFAGDWDFKPRAVGTFTMTRPEKK